MTQDLLQGSLISSRRKVGKTQIFLSKDTAVVIFLGHPWVIDWPSTHNPLGLHWGIRSYSRVRGVATKLATGELLDLLVLLSRHAVVEDP